MANHTAPPETWRPVVGFEGCYEVSDRGRVRSLDRAVMCKNGQYVRTLRGQLMKPHRGSSTADHLRVGLTRDRRKFSGLLVHVLVLEAYVGPRPPGMFGCHNDDDPFNNHLGNLRWDTPLSNVEDMNRLGNNGFMKRETCPRGHPLEMPNLMPRRWAIGHRICLACSRAFSSRQAASRRSESIDFQAVSDTHFERIMRETAV